MLMGAIGFGVLTALEKNEWGIAALITFLLIGIARESVWPFIIAVSQSKWIGWKIIIYSLATIGFLFLVKNWLAGDLF